MIDLSIIVPTRNNGDDAGHTKKIKYSLEQCLTSLVETVPQEIPIIVASNGGDPTYIPNINWERKPRIQRLNIFEQGQCKAVNAAVETTDSEWIMVSNDDQIYFDGWFDKATFWLKNNSHLRCTSAQLIEPNDGAPTFIKFFAGGSGGDFDKTKIADFINKEFWNDSRDRGYRRGFNLPFIIKRELWDLVGGYDINYDPWSSNSDSDLQCKIELAGTKTYQNQNWPVYHFGQTSGTFHPDHRDAWQKNWDYFISKWGFERPSSPDIWHSKNLINYEKLIYKPSWMGFYEKNKTNKK